MRRILNKIATLPFRVVAKISRLLFHRIVVVSVLVLLQLALYATVLIALRDSEFYTILNNVMLLLSFVAVLWIVGDESNPGYKVGWIIVVLAFVPFGGIAYLFLGGNRLSRHNQKKLKAMEQRVRQQLEGDCVCTPMLSDAVGEDAGCIASYLEHTSACPVFANTETKFYPLGDVCHKDILSALRNAKRYIFIEYFIIEERLLKESKSV